MSAQLSSDASEPLSPARHLSAGARIAVIAPSSPFDAATFELGVARLRVRYEVSFDAALHARSGYFAGDDARRRAELRAALADPRIDAIVAARGGYGAARLLPGLAVEEVRAARKLLVGFSDITALHALWARAGLRSLHATMVCGLGRDGHDDAQRARWIRTVEGDIPARIGALRPLTASRAVVSGRLLGGNLAVLASLVGTPHLPSFDGSVLFLEDVGERPYRLDRMVTQLRLAGLLDRVAAVVLGTFTDCGPGRDGVTAEAAIAGCLVGLDVPVLAGIPTGHVDDNLELPFGARVVVDSAAGTLAFLEGIA
jgi:muramoyltetrapeptide carboxypeptidase